MPRLAVVILALVAGCRFDPGALQDPGITTAQADLADAVDLALAAPDDLAAVDPVVDLAAVDLASTPHDLTVDPCANPPALGSGNLAAQCVIGSPPTIDGNLSDWPLARFVAMTRSSAAQSAGTWGTADDANSSARFFVKWDLQYLYVAVSITDDVRNTPNVSPGLSDNDAVEIFVDGLHNRTLSYGSDDWQLVYSADQQKDAAQNTIVGWPMGTVEAWGGASPAWTLEAAIPWSLLGTAATPAALGRVIGFDLKLDDNDVGSVRDRDLVQYYTAAAGGTCSAPYCRTDAFGAVQLQGR